MDGPLPSPLPVVGRIRSPHAATESTPVQSSLNRAEEAVLEVDDHYAEALEGIDGFDHLWLLCWLHQPHDQSDPPLRQVPFLLRPSTRKIGTFAMRGPRRVNPIGLSLVRLLGLEGTRVRFAGVDMVDGTPVLDIKPYVTRFDRPEGEPRCGWLDEVELREGRTPSDPA